MPEGHKRPVIHPVSAVRATKRYKKKSGVKDIGKPMVGKGRKNK